MVDVARQRVFFEVEFGGRSAGRVEFELFNDVLPRTCENFKCLCTAERGGRLSHKKRRPPLTAALRGRPRTLCG